MMPIELVGDGGDSVKGCKDSRWGYRTSRDAIEFLCRQFAGRLINFSNFSSVVCLAHDLLHTSSADQFPR
jgi:hypothetical protein